MLFKSKDEIKKIFKDQLKDAKSVDLKWAHYEERRKEKIRVLMEERMQLIEEEK